MTDQNLRTWWRFIHGVTASVICVHIIAAYLYKQTSASECRWYKKLQWSVARWQPIGQCFLSLFFFHTDCLPACNQSPLTWSVNANWTTIDYGVKWKPECFRYQNLVPCCQNAAYIWRYLSIEITVCQMSFGTKYQYQTPIYYQELYLKHSTSCIYTNCLQWR